ncbi:MAG: glutathione synthase [Gammaproteobacteria bacterium]|nr:glutathione synthase [Gammaproteobacteria bacterium]MYD80927.1 glutathione synthase [Gammaproteobacteria bacterium]
MPKVAFVVDPLETLNVKKDSSIAMMCAAQRRGWEIQSIRLKDLCWMDGSASAFAQGVTINSVFAETRDPDSLGEGEPWFQVSTEEFSKLSSFEAMFMRKDPPFDMNYIYATYMLNHAQRDGVLVVNDPQSLRDCNEKFYTTEFSELAPAMTVSQRAEVLREFHSEHRDVVYKKLDGMGGTSIFRMRENDPNLNVVIETLTDNESSPIMAQKFVPEIDQGDKRILIVDGEAIPYSLARIPMRGETRGNLAAGARGEVRALTERERFIAEELAPVLVERGLLFVGIDVIGDYLTEINVTCPTCIREIDREHDLDIAGTLMDAISNRL